MKDYQLIIVMLLFIIVSCSRKEKNETIEDSTLGIIDANVKSEDTNLKEMAKYDLAQPGSGLKYERSFENAPPLIPHTTNGFLPIKIENNICLNCHLPDKAKENGAIPLSETHFTTLRPKMVEVDGVFMFKDEESGKAKELGELNNSYFNCTQCHVPQTEVTVDIENLFTPEFRETFGIEKSSLKTKIKEGI